MPQWSRPRRDKIPFFYIGSGGVVEVDALAYYECSAGSSLANLGTGGSDYDLVSPAGSFTVSSIAYSGTNYPFYYSGNDYGGTRWLQTTNAISPLLVSGKAFLIEFLLKYSGMNEDDHDFSFAMSYEPQGIATTEGLWMARPNESGGNTALAYRDSGGTVIYSGISAINNNTTYIVHAGCGSDGYLVHGLNGVASAGGTAVSTFPTLDRKMAWGSIASGVYTPTSSEIIEGYEAQMGAWSNMDLTAAQLIEVIAARATAYNSIADKKKLLLSV